MPELKKIDFRDLDAPSAFQPPVSKKGRSLNLSGEIFSRMSQKVKIETAVLALVLLISIGLVVFYFFM